MSMTSNGCFSEHKKFTEMVGIVRKFQDFFARVRVVAKCRKHWQAWVIWLSASFWRALTPDWAVLSREEEHGLYRYYTGTIPLFPLRSQSAVLKGLKRSA